MRRWLLALVLCASPVAAAEGADRIDYVVKPGETLWSIAAQTDVYADPYLWPVIYKFNRDQIVDPSKIYEGQKLQIPIFVDTEARERARQTAISEAGPRAE